MIDRLGNLIKIEYWNYCYFDFTLNGEYGYLRIHTEKGTLRLSSLPSLSFFPVALSLSLLWVEGVRSYKEYRVIKKLILGLLGMLGRSSILSTISAIDRRVPDGTRRLHSRDRRQRGKIIIQFHHPVGHETGRPRRPWWRVWPLAIGCWRLGYSPMGLAGFSVISMWRFSVGVWGGESGGGKGEGWRSESTRENSADRRAEYHHDPRSWMCDQFWPGLGKTIRSTWVIPVVMRHPEPDVASEPFSLRSRTETRSTRSTYAVSAIFLIYKVRLPQY